MAVRVDLNADVGSSFGRWTLGDDAGLMPYITSANVSCGFHAGDPHVIRRTVELAVHRGVRVGAHVGFPDLVGYGLRELRVAPEELRDYVVYQGGALAAFVRAAGARLQHVKPHGALYHLAARDEHSARATAEAVAEIDPQCVLVLSGDVAATAARAVGIPFAAEGYVDFDYAPDGSLLPQPAAERHARTAEQAAERAVRLVVEGHVVTRLGGELRLQVKSLCIHGDAPHSAEVARTVRTALERAGVEIVPLSELV